MLTSRLLSSEDQTLFTHQRNYERVENDWYVEPVSVTERLLMVERPFAGIVLDPCCGQGNVATAFLRQANKTVYCSDLIKRKTGRIVANQEDFVTKIPSMNPDSIVSNPPYNRAQELIEAALEVFTDRVCVFLRLAFLEGQKRSEWLKQTSLARVWVVPDRVSCIPGHLLNVKQKKFSGAMAYAWFVWEKNYRGCPQIGWLPLLSQNGGLDV